MPKIMETRRMTNQVIGVDRDLKRELLVVIL